MNKKIKTKPQTPANGRFAYQGLERVIHEKARLGIVSSLATNADGLLFNDLKQLCALTDGNLNRHLAVLIEAKLVKVWKGGRNSRQQSLYRLSAEGRRRFHQYVDFLETIVADAEQAKTSAKESSGSLAGEWSPA